MHNLLAYVLLTFWTILQVYGQHYYVGELGRSSLKNREFLSRIRRGAVKQKVTKTTPPVLMCYYTNWSQYRSGVAKFVPENISVSLCTHILYAFAKIENGVLAPVEWNDDSTQWSKGMYERVNDLKKKRSGLKILLSVGGWNLGVQPFSDMVATAQTRHKFIDHAITFLQQRHFDGLDIDWEYPSNRGSPPEDKGRFTALLQELRAAFENEAKVNKTSRLLLTAAVGAGKDTIDSAYDVPGIVKSLDFINIMGYDFHGTWEQQTGFNSPLYKRSSETGVAATLNQDWAVKYWLSKGAPSTKLVLGMATYGRSFTLTSPSSHGVGAPSTGAGQAGTYTADAGVLSYYEICNALQSGWLKVFDNEQKACYAYKGNQWVGFDDTQSIVIKANYTKTMKLAGAMVWDLDLDDFGGQLCKQGPYPLISSLSKALA